MLRMNRLIAMILLAVSSTVMASGYLTPQGNGVEFSDDDSLLAAGIIDSMLMVDLIAFLEQEYALQIDEDDMTPENFDSVHAIAEYVRRKTDC